MLKMSLSLNGAASPKMQRSICASYDHTEAIHIANPELVKAKIAKIRADGPKNLSLITGSIFLIYFFSYSQHL